MSETTAEDFAAAQAKEYGTYRATEAIFYNGARAFNAGDPVPVSHVEQFGYDEQGLVEKVKSANVAAVDPANLEASKVDDLREYAAAHNIDLGDATLKADIVAAITEKKD